MSRGKAVGKIRKSSGSLQDWWQPLLLYLIGRAVGLLPEYRDQVANIMVLIGVSGVVLWISTYFLPEERSPRRSAMLRIAMAMLGISRAPMLEAMARPRRLLARAP